MWQCSKTLTKVRWSLSGSLCCKMFTEPPGSWLWSGRLMMNDVVVTDWSWSWCRQGASAVLPGRLSLFDNKPTYVDNTLLYTTNQNSNQQTIHWITAVSSFSECRSGWLLLVSHHWGQLVTGGYLLKVSGKSYKPEQRFRENPSTAC